MTYTQAINDALSIALDHDKNVICCGLGINDPKGIFGTTTGLQKRFGKERIFDMPTSENAMTGVAIGASLNGLRPIMVHQRNDFFLLAFDQLINNAAKWFYMFGGQYNVPITIRLIIGQGWGNGPTHSQSLHALFAQVPGLKVVMPSSPASAKGMLLSSIFDNNPVLFLEHRWLHGMEGDVPEGDFRIPLGKANIIRKGSDLTIVSISHMTVEANLAAKLLEPQGVSVELIDLQSIKPIDWETIFASVKKTGKFLAIDITHETCSVASELIARVSIECFDILSVAPRRLALPDYPVPTSSALTRGFYNRADDIIKTVSIMLGENFSGQNLIGQKKLDLDIPGEWFKGPF